MDPHMYCISKDLEQGEVMRVVRHIPSEETYFLTITLPPKMHKYSSQTQYELTAFDYLRIIDNSVVQITVPELTKIGNIHYHTVIKFRDVNNKFTIINQLKKKRGLGFIHLKIDPIDTQDKLINSLVYLNKDIITTTKQINRHSSQRVINISGDMF